jgi:hypothetical protein
MIWYEVREDAVRGSADRRRLWIVTGVGAIISEKATIVLSTAGLAYALRPETGPALQPWLRRRSAT